MISRYLASAFHFGHTNVVEVTNGVGEGVGGGGGERGWLKLKRVQAKQG